MVPHSTADTLGDKGTMPSPEKLENPKEEKSDKFSLLHPEKGLSIHSQVDMPSMSKVT